MARLIVIMFFCVISFIAKAETIPIELSKPNINIHDTASLFRGAKFFATVCMACHTMRYVQHLPLAQKAGIVLSKMPINQKEWLFGVTPPDLSMIAQRHSVDWLYTYLHSFYKDSQRPTGYNNLLVKNTNMTNILAPFQGQQVLTAEGQHILATDEESELPYYDILELVKSGNMSPEEFDQTISDVVNFFAYVKDPHKATRHQIGIFVLIFFIIFSIIAYKLKKIYWKKI